MGNPEAIGRPKKMTPDIEIELERIYKEESRKCRKGKPPYRRVYRIWLESQKKSIRQELVSQIKDKEMLDQATEERTKERLPGEDTVKAMLKPIEVKLKKPGPLDKPWTVGALADKNLPLQAQVIPPQVIPLILEIQEYRQNWNKLDSRLPLLTIREALWVSRLSGVVKKSKGAIPISSQLDFWARKYASYESACETTDVPPDTQSLDALVRQYPEEYALYPFIWDHFVAQTGIENTAGIFEYLVQLNAQEFEQLNRGQRLSKKDREFLKQLDELEGKYREADIGEMKQEIEKIKQLLEKTKKTKQGGKQ